MLVVCEVSRPADYAPSEIWQMQLTQELVCVLKYYFIDNYTGLNFIVIGLSQSPAFVGKGFQPLVQ
jgi:hypothetical protein